MYNSCGFLSSFSSTYGWLRLWKHSRYYVTGNTLLDDAPCYSCVAVAIIIIICHYRYHNQAFDAINACYH